MKAVSLSKYLDRGFSEDRGPLVDVILRVIEELEIIRALKEMPRVSEELKTIKAMKEILRVSEELKNH